MTSLDPLKGVKINDQNVAEIKEQLQARGLSETQINSILEDGKITKKELKKFNVYGVQVEKTAADTSEVISEEIKYNITFKALADKMKLPEDMQGEFKEFIAKKGFNVDENGEMSIDSAKAAEFNAALKEFAGLHKENFVNPNKKFATFTGDSDKATITGLVDNQVITADGGRYKINDEAELNNVLTDRVGKINYEEARTNDATLEAGVTTTTQRKVNTVEVPEDLKNNKAAREELQATAEDRYRKFAENPENRDAVDLYVAESKYAKEINKREQKLLKMETHDGKKTKRNAADIVQLYLDEYSGEEQAKKFNELATKLMNTENPDEQKKLLEILQRDLKAYGVNENSQFSDLSPVQKRNASLVAIAEASGMNPKDLLRFMAIHDVMSSRTEKEIQKDDEYFVKHQAEDYVKNCQANQEFPKSQIDLENMGKHGRKLVQSCPQLFGDAISEDQYNAGFAEDKNNFYKAEVLNLETGKYETKFFKFNQDNWKTIMKVACDPTSATEADKRLLKNLNMTLQEGRAGLEMRLPTADGRMEEIRKIIGNSNEATGNRELNRWRHLVEQTGLSVDSNPTAAKRLLHVLKNAGLGAASGMLFGGISSLFGSAITIAGQTAAQTVPYVVQTQGKSVHYSGTTDDRWINYSGETEGRFVGYSGITSGEYRDFEIQIDGKTVTVDFTTPGQDIDVTLPVAHDVNVDLSAFGQEDMTIHWEGNASGSVYVDGQTYPVTVTIDPETQIQRLWVDGKPYEGEVWVDGQKYEGQVFAEGQKYEGEVWVDGEKIEGQAKAKEGERYSDNGNNTWKQIRNAGITGGILGAIRGLATVGGVHAKGRNVDDVYDFTKLESTEETKDGNFKFEVPQYTSVEVRKGDTSSQLGFQPCKLRVKHVKDGLNRGETMEDMVAKYYNVQQGSPEYKAIFAYVQQFNTLKKFGGMQYPLHNIVNLPDYIPENIIGRKIDRIANPSDPKERLRLAEQDIPTGEGKYNPPAASVRQQERRHIQAIIRKG